MASGISDGATGFLDGGGEMGQRMRAFDWNATPLGWPADWPQSLKTIVRVMLDSRFAMWMLWGPEGTFFCNDAYLPTVGVKRDWVLGARSDRVWEEIWSDIGPRIAHVLATGQATFDAGLQLFLRRSGYDEETFHTFSYSPVYDEASRVAGMLCVVVEDTERVISERRLRVLRTLAARSTADAASLDDAGRTMLEALSSGRFDVPFATLYFADAGGVRPVGPGAEAPALRAAARAAIDSRRETLVDLSGKPPGDAPVPDGLGPQSVPVGPWPEPVVQALAVPLRKASQAETFGCLVLGVSTRRRLDEAYRSFLGLVADQFTAQLLDADLRLQAEQRAATLTELDRAKNVFFSNVSHEFRTPLTLMLGPIANLLARGGLPEDTREDLELVRQNGLRLRRLVNSLLDFSRIEAGRADAHYTPTDLAQFTRDIASVFRSAVEHAGLRLNVRCEPLPEAAYVDRDMWEKVVLNLLSNALKFTFEGRIDVELGLHHGQAQLVVRDSGVGIAADQLPRVFERFHRVQGVRSRSQEGSGIGLALVKELVKLHGGSVNVDSRVGQGTAFTVRMPLGRAHLAPERVRDDADAVTDSVGDAPSVAASSGVDRSAFVDDALRGQRTTYGGSQRPAGTAPPPARGAEASPGTGGARQRILVADDNADMRAYIQRLLAPSWEVTAVADGQAALDAIARERPDLVLSDVMMPRLDGRALLQRLRSDPQTQSLPVILLSAQAGDEARVAGLNEGADDYLVKPFSTPELLARVELQLMRVALKRAEDLRNQRLAEIFRHAPVGVAVLRGPDLVYEYVNAGYLDYVGQRPLLGLPVRQALPELEGQDVYELLDRVFASGEVYRGHAKPVSLRDAASDRMVQRYFEFVYQPLPPDERGERGIASVSIDVTALMQARTEAEAANRAKDEFIAMLGHELRNPLSPIFTALQVMRMRDGQALVKERDIIDRQVRHMARLVDDLLDISRITRGNVELKKSVVELAAVVDRALEMCAPLLEAQRHALTLALPRSGLAVHADPTRLAQVVANVLTNAAKFTPPGGRIALSAQADGPQVVLSVRDTGIGMTAEELEQVFGLFVQGAQGMQGHQGLNRAAGGLGLGLAIARNLARLHGGSLSALSGGPGQGSEFTLRLPLHETQSAVLPHQPHTLGPQAAPGPAPPAAPAPGTAARRVLIVDDNLDAAALLSELLGLRGHQVELAPDGPSALRRVDEGAPFDVALLDIGLPVMSGYELAQHLRQRPAGQRTRLVALTGYGQEGDVRRGRRSGFEEHLVKPVDFDQLVRAVEAAPALPAHAAPSGSARSDAA